MPSADHERMTSEAFLFWHIGLDGLYELVDGVPIPHAKMLDGVSAEHDITTVNLIGLLVPQLRGTDRRVATGRVPIRTGPATMRRPDLAVVGGPVSPDDLESRDPSLVIEILSPTTNDIERFRRLGEYQRLSRLAYILLVETTAPQALLYQRAQDGWTTAFFEGLDTVIELPEIGASLPLSETYERIPFGRRRNAMAPA